MSTDKSTILQLAAERVRLWDAHYVRDDTKRYSFKALIEEKYAEGDLVLVTAKASGVRPAFVVVRIVGETDMSDLDVGVLETAEFEWIFQRVDASAAKARKDLDTNMRRQIMRLEATKRIRELSESLGSNPELRQLLAAVESASEVK